MPDETRLHEREDLASMAMRDPDDVHLPAVVAPSISVIAQTEVITATRVAVPRDYGRVLSKLKQLAAMAGEDWYYRFPVKNRRENRTDYIEGPSVKCATAVAREFGNCAVDCRSVDQGPVTVFLARFVDMETGFQLTRPFQQRKSQQTLRGDAERAADIVYQIGASKATRNVICNALEMFTNYAFDQAKQNLVEKVGKNLESYRAKVVARLAEMQIDLTRVERILGKTAKEWLAPEIARLIAEIQAINDGMANKDDLYPAPVAEGGAESQQTTGTKLDQFNEQGAADKTTGTTPHDPGTGEFKEAAADSASKKAPKSKAAPSAGDPRDATDQRGADPKPAEATAPQQQATAPAGGATKSLF